MLTEPFSLSEISKNAYDYSVFLIIGLVFLSLLLVTVLLRCLANKKHFEEAVAHEYGDPLIKIDISK